MLMPSACTLSRGPQLGHMMMLNKLRSAAGTATAAAATTTVLCTVCTSVHCVHACARLPREQGHTVAGTQMLRSCLVL
jgi:hypothetical protein